MRRFAALLERFRSDESGAFLVIFGVLAIVLVATSGAVVDYTAIEQARTRAQVALDTASLGLQPSIYTTSVPELTAKAQDLLVQQLDTASGQSWGACPSATVPPCAQVDAVTVDTAEGTLHIEARIRVPTAFVALLGIQEVTAGVVSEATRKKLNLEVVMVLDNSGSMAWSSPTRISELKKAATCATNVLFGNDCADSVSAPTTTNVKLGIVPFTEFVNVGTANRTAAWMDTTGASSISRHNFDDDDNDATPFTGTVNRFELFDQLQNVSWTGCVEARPTPYDTDDTTPTAADPDTLFVPVFSPDEPDSGFYNSYIADEPANCPRTPTWVWKQVKTQCTSKGNNAKNYDSATCTGSTTDTYVQTDENGVVTDPSTPPATLYNNTPTCSTSYSSSGWSSYTNTRVQTCTYNFSDRERQERLCKYDGATVNLKRDGPNNDCPSNALLPLTDDKGAVLGRISTLKADGGTNIHQGTIWGYHALSPTAPLTEAEDYGGANSKVMIIMTDGENTHSYVNNMNKASWYVAYGYPYNGRLTGNSTAALQEEMNARTLTTCTNAKAAKGEDPGIIIYTIGLDPPNTATRDLLTACASDPSKAFFPTDATELTDVFETIAHQLSNLRLAR